MIGTVCPVIAIVVLAVSRPPASVMPSYSIGVAELPLAGVLTLANLATL
jgi:hypothetical protein